MDGEGVDAVKMLLRAGGRGVDSVLTVQITSKRELGNFQRGLSHGGAGGCGRGGRLPVDIHCGRDWVLTVWCRRRQPGRVQRVHVYTFFRIRAVTADTLLGVYFSGVARTTRITTTTRTTTTSSTDEKARSL